MPENMKNRITDTFLEMVRENGLDRVTVKEYRSGHMPYLGEETASQLEADIRAFIR